MELNMEILPERIKLIQLQMTLLRALESHTLSQRQWKGDLPCVQITGYVFVCVQVWVIHSLFEWMTRTHRVHDIQIPGIHTHTYPKAWLGERGGVLNWHRCNESNTFLWVVSCWCVWVIEKSVYDIHGHTGWFPWSMFVYDSQKICLHMLHILGVFSFMCQEPHYI